MHFLIAQRRSTGVSHVRLFGELDLAARDPLRQVLLRSVADGSSVVIDLAAAEFLDSEALSALIEGHGAAVAAGVGFELVGARGSVRRVLQVTGALLFE